MKSAPPLPPRDTWTWLVDAALSEDVGSGDVTSVALIPSERQARTQLEAREPLVLSGLPIAAEIFARFGARLECAFEDGARLDSACIVGTVSGPARGILTAERTALNFAQRLCGIATWTDRFLRSVGDTQASIVDTRKTTPGWRTLEKYAVACGGGVNHRFGLFDGVLIKDNHVAAVGSVGEATKLARERCPVGLRIQVEVESVDQARAALDAGADLLLVDNQPPETIRAVVELVRGRIPVEATGGIDLANIAEVAHTGVDRISIGALTHSAPAVDLGLEWIEASSS